MPFYLATFGRAYLREFGLFYLLAIYAAIETKGLFWERDFLRWAFGTWPAAPVAWGLLALLGLLNLLFLLRQIRGFPALRNLVSCRRAFWELNEFFHILCTPLYGYGILVGTKQVSPWPLVLFVAASTGFLAGAALALRHALFRRDPPGRTFQLPLRSPGLWRVFTLLSFKPGSVVTVKVLSLVTLLAGSMVLAAFDYGSRTFSVFFILIVVLHLGLFVQVLDLEGEHVAFLWGHPVGMVRSLLEQLAFIAFLFLPEALTLLWFGLARSPMPGLSLSLLATALVLWQGTRILAGMGVRASSTFFPLLMFSTVLVMALTLAGIPPWALALGTSLVMFALTGFHAVRTSRGERPWVW